MSGNKDIAKGRIKQAAGVLINNEKMRENGKTDQAIGKAKKRSVHPIDRSMEKAGK